ncbi:phosphotransferase [Parahaliea aestuarii]|uniref:Phosphotransferase n=1 Tax=Parahaliea aestuarii TaxID=1852021 RepID=A0A5C8ZVH3_9GAMM|nr:phosphotransferase [Parahaliea aestuarii]TXS91754.1 phosphotransferase [Parahaliea aestuarii]
MSTGDFPQTPEALTPQRLTDYLLADGVLAEGEVTAVDATLIGHGKMGSNARLSLRYAGEQGGAPTTLIAKLPAEDPKAREMAGAGGAYYNEVMFYRHLAGGTSMRTPRIYASEISDCRTGFLLLMEDLVDARPGSNLEGASRRQAEMALREVARLAAAYYGDESIAALDHVLTAARDDGGAFGQALLEQSWPGFVDRFGAGLSPACLAFGERFVQHAAHFTVRLQGPKTLVHGDFRAENLLFGSQRATVVDWQTVSESSVLTDAAYFLGGSVDTADRRAWEGELVASYCDWLAQDGVDLPFVECWAQYREYAMHGLLITILGASFSSADERGDAMFQLMIQRHLQHCLDVGAGEFLPA